LNAFQFFGEAARTGGRLAPQHIHLHLHGDQRLYGSIMQLTGEVRRVDTEALIQTITDRVIAAIGKQA